MKLNGSMMNRYHILRYGDDGQHEPAATGRHSKDSWTRTSCRGLRRWSRLPQKRHGRNDPFCAEVSENERATSQGFIFLNWIIFFLKINKYIYFLNKFFLFTDTAWCSAAPDEKEDRRRDQKEVFQYCRAAQCHWRSIRRQERPSVSARLRQLHLEQPARTTARGRLSLRVHQQRPAWVLPAHCSTNERRDRLHCGGEEGHAERADQPRCQPGIPHSATALHRLREKEEPATQRPNHWSANTQRRVHSASIRRQRSLVRVRFSLLVGHHFWWIWLHYSIRLSLWSGHYWAYVRRTGGLWSVRNDEHHSIDDFKLYNHPHDDSVELIFCRRVN